ncbi:MAG: type I pullulanase, partial [Muribaculaceae bacterium]|nr:type I pullulanase [Muribaculaceae bacterium]
MKTSRLLGVAVAAMLSLNAMASPEMTYTPQATTFKVMTLGTARGVTLRLYDQGLGGKASKTLKMTPRPVEPAEGGQLEWTVTVKGDLKGKFYTFDVAQGKKSLGETPGIWATAVGVNGQRAAVLDMAATNPAGWDTDRRPDIAAKDLVLYELHHRDFSIDPSSGFQHKGKYLALTEPRAIAHLKALGVNAVHILPSFDYASVDETRLNEPQYNWGYDPVNYNVPEGGYSTDPYKPEVRISEFKQMVQALHRAGIKVVLDVVYNHTFNIDGSNFQRTMPDYFFRKNADGSYSNGSGCGNETASERRWMREFMMQSVKYWVDEYHIDGFRFDLMGLHDLETMQAIEQAVHQINA